MDPLHLGIAIGPLGVYLFWIGLLNLRRRATLLSGATDGAALALGVSGLAIAGPLELFMPEQAAVRFGPWVWVLLVGLYSMGSTLWLLSSRPRLVIYNLASNRLRGVLAPVAIEVDSEARWSGDTLLLPQLGVHLSVEAFGLMRNVTLASVGAKQNVAGWNELAAALREALAAVPTERNPRGYSLISSAVLLLAFAVWRMITSRAELAENLHEMLRLPPM
jgi:hypothetical protein